MPEQTLDDVDLLVVGHVATMEFFVTFPDIEDDAYTGNGSEFDVPPEQVLRKRSVHEELESRVNAEVKAALGPDFEIESVIVKRGSLEVLAAIMTVSSVVVNYNTLVEGIERAVNNTRRALSALLRATLGRRGGREVLQMAMNANWSRGSGLIRAETRAAVQNRASAAAVPAAPAAASMLVPSSLLGRDAQRVVGVYFLLSNSVLIGILIALLVREW